VVFGVLATGRDAGLAMVALLFHLRIGAGQ
jgi:hypothetical protein